MGLQFLHRNANESVIGATGWNGEYFFLKKNWYARHRFTDSVESREFSQLLFFSWFSRTVSYIEPSVDFSHGSYWTHNAVLFPSKRVSMMLFSIVLFIIGLSWRRGKQCPALFRTCSLLWTVDCIPTVHCITFSGNITCLNHIFLLESWVFW